MTAAALTRRFPPKSIRNSNQPSRGPCNFMAMTNGLALAN